MDVRLPTEAEWEFAARGGLAQKLYPWGDAPVTSRTGYAARWIEGPEPVATSEPNGYGLFDMCENVHEWCSRLVRPALLRRVAAGESEGSGERDAKGVPRRGLASSHQDRSMRRQKQHSTGIPLCRLRLPGGGNGIRRLYFFNDAEILARYSSAFCSTIA